MKKLLFLHLGLLWPLASYGMSQEDQAFNFRIAMFAEYFASEDALDQLADNEHDRQILSLIKASIPEIERASRVLASEHIKAFLCNEKNVDPMALAQVLTQADVLEAQSTRNAIEQKLSNLSENGRANLDQFIRSNISPGVRSSQTDYADLARRFPERLIQNVRRMCQFSPEGGTSELIYRESRGNLEIKGSDG